jgi:hypothetical protein
MLTMANCGTTPVKFVIRRDTTAGWMASSSILASGEPSVNTDNGQMKIGNGSSLWKNLQYVGSNAPTGPTGPVGPTDTWSSSTYGMPLDAGGPTTTYASLPKFDCGGITGTVATDFTSTLLYSLFIDPWVSN